MKKELTFSARLSTEEFDRSIEQIQRKLKEIQSSTNVMSLQGATGQRLQGAGFGGILSQPTMEAYQKSTQQYRRDIDQMIKEQAQGQEKLGKMIAQRTDKLKEMKNEYREHLKFVKEDLELKEKISRVEESNFRLREMYKQRDSALNQALDAKEKASPGGIAGLVDAYKGGGIGGIGRALGGSARGLAFSGLGALAGALPAAISVYRGYGQAPISTAASSGAAAQGTYGRELEAIYAGRSPFENSFLGEKGIAAGMASKNATISRRADIASLFAPIAIGAAGGAAAGSLFGGVGALPGAAIGGIAGLGKSAYDVATDPRKRSLAMSPFSDTFSKQYEATIAKEFAENFQTALEGQKQQNPLKRLAAEEYQNSYMRNLQFQRSVGLDYRGFTGAGGFREGAINAGFTDQMAMEQSGAILGAGGSTRMARQSPFALQASRGFDLTNASSVLGTLSGTLGSAESSKQAFVKMIAEGNRIGLDSSEYREESRKFMEATAQVVARSETGSQGDIDRIIRQFGGFMAEPTGRGVQAAQNAYQLYNQATSATTGPQGVMRAAGFLNDEVIGGMSPMDRAALASIPTQQLSTDHPIVKDLARRYKTTPQEIVNRSMKAGAGSLNRLAAGDEVTNRLIKERQGASGLTGAAKDKANAQIGADEDRLATILGVEYPQLAASPKDLMAMVKGVTTGSTEDRTKAMQDIQKRLSAPETGRVEDETVRGMAESSRLMLENFRAFKDQVVPTADAIAKFNSRLKETVDIIMKLPEHERNSFFSKFAGLFSDSKSQTQTQSGR